MAATQKSQPMGAVEQEGGMLRWYEGRTLLVTGGAGFMGKVLLEKLLRAVPGLRRVYVLLRSKRGVAPARRLRDLTALPVFDRLRREQPEVLGKLCAVEGDLLTEGLGLSMADRSLLLAEVSVVLHGAASLRLEAEMGPALRHNLLGTQRVLQLAAQMPHLKAFVHMSTAFCHPDVEVLEERIYQSPVPPADLLRFSEWLGDDALKLLTPRLLGGHPNCYTYSKRLAEALVAEARPRMPVLVVRPAIVTPTFKEPMPGWVDSLNGPVGVVVGAGKGVIRSMLCGRHFRSQTIPVDIAVNAIIAATWDAALHRAEEKETPVYNLSTGDVVPITWGEVLDRGRSLVYEYPFEGVVWYPDGDIRVSRVAHSLLIFFFLVVPAYLLDFFILLSLHKPFLVRLQKRICVGLEVLQYFTMRPWDFKVAKGLALEQRMAPHERDAFYIADVDVDVDDYLLNTVLGARQYCMKEPLSSLPRARIQLKIMFVVHTLAKIMFWGLVLYLLLKWIEPLRTMLDTASNGLLNSSFFRTITIQ